MSTMKNRDKNILDAALRVFSRYGVKRSSMSDVAGEAGISRQTLYKSFNSKDEILRAHILAFADDAVEKMEAGLAKVEGLGPQLDLIFENMTVAGFEMVRTTPNAQDFEEGFEKGSREALEANAKRFQAVIASVLLPYASELTKAGLSPEILAEYTQRSARAAKGYAKDRKHLMQQLNTLKQLCLEATKS